MNLKGHIHRNTGWVLLGCLAAVCTQAVATTSMTESRVMDIQPKEIKIARDRMASYGATLRLPEFSDAEEREILGLIEDETRFYISISRPVQVYEANWENVGQEDGFNIWQLHIHSPQAFGLQVDFSEFGLQEGMSVKVYGTSDSQMPNIGEYTRDLGYQGHFTSILIPGDTIVVEAWMPIGSGVTAATFPFKIKRIYHQFRDGPNNVRGVKSFSLSEQQAHNNCPILDGRCNYPNAQVQPWRSAGQMISGGAACSGSLINPRQSLPAGSALFLTAYHCIENAQTDPEMARGTVVNATFRFGASPCAPSNGPIATAGRARFIAGSTRGDYALLQVENITRTGSDPGPALAGYTTQRLSAGVLQLFHHSAALATQQYTRSEITGFSTLVAIGEDSGSGRSDTFNFCGSSSGCSHYDLHSIEGGTRGGSSGGGWFLDTDGTGREFALNAVNTHGSDAVCTQRASLFSKIYEDGRVECALSHGGSYVTAGNTADGQQCNDRARPSYTTGGSSGGGGGGGSGAVSVAELIALIVLSGLAMIATMRRRKALSGERGVH